MKRRYFVSFLIENKEHNSYYNWITFTLNNGIFDIEKVIAYIKKERNCDKVVILFFKELKNYEK